MLRNARSSPARLRVISTLSRPTCTVRNAPGRSRSALRTAQNHIASKRCSCSCRKTDGEVYQGPGRVVIRLGDVAAGDSGATVMGFSSGGRGGGMPTGVEEADGARDVSGG